MTTEADVQHLRDDVERLSQSLLTCRRALRKIIEVERLPACARNIARDALNGEIRP